MQPWAQTWPFFRPGLCLAYFGPHLVTILGGGATRDGFADYLSEVDRVIRAWPEDWRGCTVIHLDRNEAWKRMSLSERSGFMKEWAELLGKHREKLGRTIAYSATICPGALARAVVRTVNVIRPPSMPTGIVATIPEAWQAVRRTFPELDVAEHAKAHEALLRASAEVGVKISA